MKRKKYFLFLAVAAITFLSFCSRVEPLSMPINSETKTQESNNLSTSTMSVIPKSTPNPKKSPTPLPIISHETAKEVLTRLLQTNGGCKLPCLLGLTPGISGQAETSAFQSYFQDIEYPLSLRDNKVGIVSRTRDTGGGIRLEFWNEDTAADLSLGYYTDQDVVSQVVFTSWANQHFDYGVKSLYDDSNYIYILEYFSLTNILNTYGPPSEILIAPFPDDEGHPSPPAQYSFSIVLIYSQEGFLVQYVSIRDQDEKYFIGCPANSHIDVSVWNPKQSLSISNAVMYFSGVDSINKGNINYFKKIDEATPYNIQSFYKDFKSLNSKSCIRTPKDLWQLP